ncbi:MAG: hypothetical protein EZS28_016082 [Streblomastix strix]|uniref:Uncharacterized protein n=1 Tax=Streblomastix strix TaxID=222440 RepID=A0A5J4W1I7_9EUKA|nr:MAG: hypothetical protein EZS28_016082 [Streblomastix strix]
MGEEEEDYEEDYEDDDLHYWFICFDWVAFIGYLNYLLKDSNQIFVIKVITMEINVVIYLEFMKIQKVFGQQENVNGNLYHADFQGYMIKYSTHRGVFVENQIIMDALLASLDGKLVQVIEYLLSMSYEPNPPGSASQDKRSEP